MIIDMNATINDLKNQPVIGDGNKPVLLRDVVQGALLATLKNDENISGVKKAKFFSLAMLCNQDEVDLKADDIVLIKERVGIAATPLAVGRAYELLDK